MAYKMYVLSQINSFAKIHEVSNIYAYAGLFLAIIREKDDYVYEHVLSY